MTQKLITAAQIDVGSSSGQIAVHNGSLNADLLGGLASASYYLASNPSSFISGNQSITLSGDIAGSGATTIAGTLATVNANTGAFGDSTHVATFTVNAKGLTTAASSTAIVFPVTSFNTRTGAITLSSSDVTTALGYTPGNGSGTVSSVAVSGTSGIGVSGSPITVSGTINLSLGSITPNSVNASGTVFGSNISGSTSGTNTGDQTITLTGDMTGSGTGSFATTLATVNSNVGAFGDASHVGVFTVNGKGLITAASNTAITAPAGTLSGTTLNSSVVSSSLTSVGTITSGVWTGTAIAAVNGGTGQTSYTVNDILYASSTTALSRLGIGSTGTVLTSNGPTSAPSWQAGGGGATVSTTGGTGAVQYNVGGVLTSDTGHVWTSGTQTLLLGTAATAGIITSPQTATIGQQITLLAAGGVATGTAAANTGGLVIIQSGIGATSSGGNANSAAGGTLSLKGGNGGNGGPSSGSGFAGTGGAGAPITITAGTGGTGGNASAGAAVSGPGGAGGALTIQAGGGGTSPTPTGTASQGGNGSGGTLTIAAGVGGGPSNAPPGIGGSLIFQTAPGLTLIERLRILPTGDWSVGSNGTSVGTSGQVLTSQGSSTPPVWQTISASGVTSLTGTANQITASASTGAVTLSLPTTLTLGTAGTGPIINVTAGTTAGTTFAINGSAATGINSAGGNVIISGGTGGSTSGNGGNLILQNGASQAGSLNGSVIINTGTTSYTQRMSIDTTGAWTCQGSSLSFNLSLGSFAYTAGNLNTGAGTAGGFTWTAGSGGTTSANAGSFLFTGGSSGVAGHGSNFTVNLGSGSLSAGGAISLTAGTGTQYSNGGDVSIAAGATVVPTGGSVNNGGNINITAGTVVFSGTPGSNTGGNITIATGQGNISGGSIVLKTGATTTSTTVLTINASGAIGTSSSPSYGTSGQVLTSAGSGAVPTWTTPNNNPLKTTLVAGTKSITDATVTASTVVLVTVQTPGGTQGFLSVAVTAGTGFVINSTSATETSVVAYFKVG